MVGTEACDDNNSIPTDGCFNGTISPGYICQFNPPSVCALCGDGLLREFETCDDGDPADGDGCASNC